MDLGTDIALVSGAAGWLGSCLVRALGRGLPDVPGFEPPRGLRVRGLLAPGQDRPAEVEGVDWREGDLRSCEDCAKFVEGARGAVLFHAAGVIHPRRVREFYEVNHGGTRRLLEAAARAGVRRAVVVSSNSPCGCNPRADHLFDESSPFHPYMNYGRSKMLMERSALDLHLAGALEVVIARAPWFYGPNQPPRQTLFFKMVREGKGPIVGSGLNRRSMAYVDNLCQGLLLAAAVPRAAGGTYWIADRRPYAMSEIMDAVERLLEGEFGMPCAHRRLRLPSFVADAAGVVDAAVQSLGLYHPKIHVLSEMNKTIACSIEKARAELGYEPAVALEEGMRRSIRWCLERGFLP